MRCQNLKIFLKLLKSPLHNLHRQGIYFAIIFLMDTDTCSLICQGTSTRRPFRFLSQAATCYHSKIETIPLSTLLKDANELAVYPHTILLTLNAKQGSCEYQLLKSSGLTRRWIRTQVYRRFNF